MKTVCNNNKTADDLNCFAANIIDLSCSRFYSKPKHFEQQFKAASSLGKQLCLFCFIWIVRMVSAVRLEQREISAEKSLKRSSCNSHVCNYHFTSIRTLIPTSCSKLA